MARCYAEKLGDCGGPIEREHFFPQSVQRMLGGVTVGGFSWQAGQSKKLPAGGYAKAKIICKRHHDQLDGLDAVGGAYFRNLMLIMNKLHIASGAVGRADELTTMINGRELERWLLKTVCGMVAARSFNRGMISSQWIDVLFNRALWPDHWALYMNKSKVVTTDEHAGVNFDFAWATDGSLNGILIRAFGMETMFALSPPDYVGPELLHRPSFLRYKIDRPDGGDVLTGVKVGEEIRLYFRWPILASRGLSRLC